MTITGRFANLASNRFARAARFQGRVHARLYRRFGGRRWTRWLRRPVFLLTVQGRSTGQPCEVMLMLICCGHDLLVCGSNGGNHATPNWYRNLMAAGKATATVGPESWSVRARQVEGRERDECWNLLCDAYPDFATYQALTDRQLPIAVLEPTHRHG